MYWFESVTNTRKKTQRTIPHFFLFHLPSFENRIWLISSTWSNQGLIPLSVFVWAPFRPINTSLILTSSLYTFPSFISPHCHYKSLFTISQALRLNLQKPIPFRPESLDSLPHSFGIRYYLSRSKQQQSNSDNTSYRRVVRSESCIKSNPRVKSTLSQYLSPVYRDSARIHAKHACIPSIHRAPFRIYAVGTK
jgi:hypothetical protein